MSVICYSNIYKFKTMTLHIANKIKKYASVPYCIFTYQFHLRHVGDHFSQKDKFYN